MSKITRLICLFILLSGTVIAQGPKNLSLLGTLTFPGQRLSGCWHYTDSTGKEYALIGAEQGIVIADISGAQPVVITQLPGVSSLWHEVKVIGDYAYATTEGFDTTFQRNGVQIIDLRFLPDSIPFRFYTGDGAINQNLLTAHSIAADDRYLYVNGHNDFNTNRGVIILDAIDPWNPTFVGAVTTAYCHDSYIRGDRLYTSDIIDGQFSVYDVSDRSNPILLARQATPGNFNHNSWLNDAGNVLFTTDEVGGQPLGAFDISDLSNITLIDTFFNGNFPQSEVHNVRVINDYLINPSYGSQLTIADATRPDNLIEVANYTTGNSLCWDADPYLPSGRIIATDMNSGMFFVFQPTYVRACHLEGVVTDSITGNPIVNTSVIISSISVNASTDLIGKYRTGYADSGTYQVRFIASGYTDEFRTVQLQNGVLTTLNVRMKSSNASVTDPDVGRIDLFPNPTTDRLSVVSQRLITGYDLYDLNGKLIRSKSDQLSKEFTIDVADISAGDYTLLLRTEQGTVNRKVKKFR